MKTKRRVLVIERVTLATILKDGLINFINTIL